MKFLADMGISLRTVAWLRDAGYDVVHLRDRGLQRLPDEEILIKARTEGRILLHVAKKETNVFIGALGT